MAVNIDEIKSIIAEILEVEVSEVELETHFVDELNADSLKVLEILATLEKNYEIRIPEESLREMVTLKAVIEIMEQISNTGQS